MEQDDALVSQLDYYRARADEYDVSIGGEAALLTEAGPSIKALGHFDTALELACGTGIWTRLLAESCDEVTAVDAAPEMIEKARRLLGDRAVRFVVADAFTWQPEQTYGLVFFANWLTHVPPSRLDAFLANVTQAVQPGGWLVMVEQETPSPEDESIAEGIYAHRPLRDGREFTIVKVFRHAED
ncbi:MAG TPA: class I SAM-dependent methyltransferase, partial [Dehalococcoidia bacterium]|nr:class I SAM-dependent methyltransferase [Dehalococcoidia bacterium]